MGTIDIISSDIVVRSEACTIDTVKVGDVLNIAYTANSSHPWIVTSVKGKRVTVKRLTFRADSPTLRIDQMTSAGTPKIYQLINTASANETKQFRVMTANPNGFLRMDGYRPYFASTYEGQPVATYHTGR